MKILYGFLRGLNEIISFRIIGIFTIFNHLINENDLSFHLLTSPFMSVPDILYCLHRSFVCFLLRYSLIFYTLLLLYIFIFSFYTCSYAST